MNNHTEQLNTEELEKSIKEVFTMGMWHDVPSGYQRTVDRLVNVVSKAITNERERIVNIIKGHMYDIPEYGCVCVPGEEMCHVCVYENNNDDLQDIINQINKGSNQINDTSDV